MPEYLKKRFQSHSVRTCLTIMALISYVFTKFSVSILVIITAYTAAEFPKSGPSRIC